MIMKLDIFILLINIERRAFEYTIRDAISCPQKKAQSVMTTPNKVEVTTSNPSPPIVRTSSCYCHFMHFGALH